MRYFNMAEIFKEKRRRERKTALFQAYLYNQDTGNDVPEHKIPEDLMEYIVMKEPYAEIIRWILDNCGKNEYGSACGQFSDMWLDCYSDDKDIESPPSIVFRFKEVNYILYWSENQA
jgi:hypothetical protein